VKAVPEVSTAFLNLMLYSCLQTTATGESKPAQDCLAVEMGVDGGVEVEERLRWRRSGQENGLWFLAEAKHGIDLRSSAI
jgi:hypothetical protein